MAKVILEDGSEEYLAPRIAREMVSSGKAKFPEFDSVYQTRELKAEQKKPKRKRRTKAEIEAAKEAELESSEDESE